MNTAANSQKLREVEVGNLVLGAVQPVWESWEPAKLQPSLELSQMSLPGQPQQSRILREGEPGQSVQVLVDQLIN